MPLRHGPHGRTVARNGTGASPVDPSGCPGYRRSAMARRGPASLGAWRRKAIGQMRTGGYLRRSDQCGVLRLLQGQRTGISHQHIANRSCEAEAKASRRQRGRAASRGTVVAFTSALGTARRGHGTSAKSMASCRVAGGKWYSQTLDLLFPGARVFVNFPGKGYVGVGTAVEK